MSTEDTRQRAVHRHAQDPPSLADLVDALTRSANASFKASSDALKAARETRALTVALSGLSALAEAWEDEAGDDLTPRMCARQLREALAKGVPG